jgi:hypothetical protein
MADELAFTLTEDFSDMVGGTLADPEGRTIDLAELLHDTDDGNVDGVVVTNDEFLKNALNTDFRFKEVPIPDSYSVPADAGGPSTSELKGMLKADLQAAYVTKFGQPAPDDFTVARLRHELDPEGFPPVEETPGLTNLTPDGSPVPEDDAPKED